MLREGVYWGLSGPIINANGREFAIIRGYLRRSEEYLRSRCHIESGCLYYLLFGGVLTFKGSASYHSHLC